MEIDNATAQFLAVNEPAVVHGSRVASVTSRQKKVQRLGGWE